MSVHDKYINSMRLISLHAIKKASQGHAGMSMSAAPITYTLFTKHIHLSKENPKWINRDRFILSAGHGSLSLYSIFYFAKAISLDDFKNFKKNNWIMNSHPEYSENNFIDASTGPLGQGVGMGVGTAIAEQYLRFKFSKLDGLVNHYTYVLVGDGDLQEGVSYEAMSLAGKLKLNKLIILHDSNDYQLDSSVVKVNSENLKLRMESMGWVYFKVDGNVDEIDWAINLAKKQNKPSFIEVKTTIGFGTHLSNNNKSHSMNLKDEDIEYANNFFGLNNSEFDFENDQDLFEHFKVVFNKKDYGYNDWKTKYLNYQNENSLDFIKFNNYLNKNYDLERIFNKIKFEKTSVATRNYVKDLMTLFKENSCDWIIAGCADLEAATNIKINDTDFNDDYFSNNIKFGIREFAMGTITNGILLHSFLKTISGTFLVFSDYLKSAIRLGAIMKIPNTYIFTHDCYQVGGDGPTHQPVEQLAMLRSIPNILVWKPCDEKEFLAASYCALKSKHKTNILILTRHGLTSERNTSITKSIKFGGYELNDINNPDLTLLGSGTEIDLLIEVKEELEKQGYKVKVISVPSLNLLLVQEEKYIRDLLDSKYGVFSIESSSDTLWYKLHRYSKKFYHYGATKFGYSMDGDKLYKQMGFEKENILNLILKELVN